MRFLVWDPEQDGTPGDEFFGGRVVEAVDAEEAARAWAGAHDDEHAGPIAGRGEVVELCIRPAGGGITTRWRVEGEMEPVYRARELS